MQITTSGHHVEITPAMSDYINEKFARLERHFDRVNDIHVVLSVEKQQQKAEATIHVNGNTLFAASEEADMYAAIDLLVDKLDRQLLKHKEKQNDHRGGSVPTAEA